MKFDDTARFFSPSEKLWPELFSAPSTEAKTLCRDCRKVVVSGIKRFCGKCGHRRKLAANRESYRKRLNSGKTKNSPIDAQGLTDAKIANGYHHSQGRVRPSFSSNGPVAKGASESQ